MTAAGGHRDPARRGDPSGSCTASSIAPKDIADVGSDVIAHGRLRDRRGDVASNRDKRRGERVAMIEGLGTAAEDAATANE